MEDKKILLSHGDGGALTQELIKTMFMPRLSNPFLAKADDAAIITFAGDLKLAFTTDSFVVDPIFFPGGDIGKLAVYGTLNDLWVSGALPSYISAGFIIEEGMSFTELEMIIRSMEEALALQNIPLATGDTKVVPRGKGDKIFINTSAVGVIPKERSMKRRIEPGQKVVVSGPIAEHGTAILASRMGIGRGQVKSDCGPVGADVERLFESGLDVSMMRDPTRGGLATVLKEIAQASSCDVYVYEERIPIKPEVKEVCDLLGLDPLYLACEGRAVAFVGEGMCPSGWAEIGQVAEGRGQVFIKTLYGGTRRLDLLEGTPLPRIC